MPCGGNLYAPAETTFARSLRFFDSGRRHETELPVDEKGLPQ